MTKNQFIKMPVMLLAVSAWVLTSVLVQASEITVYKSPSCGCCKKWVSHLRNNGLKVIAIDVKSVVPYKIKHGVTQPLASCHTALVGGYTIEGHVPAADIKRLLKNRPKVKGLTVPGMPMGTPGMEGPRKDAYDVLTFDANGKRCADF